MPVFEVCVIQKPTKREAEDGQLEKLVTHINTVIARDSQAAAIMAIVDGDIHADVDRTRLEVLVRPFG